MSDWENCDSLADSDKMELYEVSGGMEYDSVSASDVDEDAIREGILVAMLNTFTFGESIELRSLDCFLLEPFGDGGSAPTVARVRGFESSIMLRRNFFSASRLTTIASSSRMRLFDVLVVTENDTADVSTVSPSILSDPESTLFSPSSAFFDSSDRLSSWGILISEMFVMSGTNLLVVKTKDAEASKPPIELRRAVSFRSSSTKSSFVQKYAKRPAVTSTA